MKIEVFKVKKLKINFLSVNLKSPISFTTKIENKKDKYYFSENGFHNVGDKAAIKIKGKKNGGKIGKDTDRVCQR